MNKLLYSVLALSMIMHITAYGQSSNNVIAHRGSWLTQGAPENSLASLQNAISLGCKGSEFDVWMTKDGVLIVHHDPTIEGLSIENSNWQDLKKLKLSDGKRMPTLVEYIKLGKKQSVTKLVLELKMSKISPQKTLEAAKKCVQTVKKLKARPHVDYISFDYEACKKIIQLDPEAKVSYVNWKHDKDPTQMKADGFYGVDYHFKVFKQQPELIEEFRKQGITLNTWTIDDPADMKWFVEQQFDYITTDKAEELLKLYR